MFSVNVETDNAAFGDREPEPACAECARIVRIIAGELDAGRLSGSIRDVNGNRVGTWELTAE